MSFISPMGSQLERFLRHQHGLGVAYTREAAFLRELDRMAAVGTDRTLSETLVRRYLAGASQDGRPHRLTVVRQLAKFLAVEEAGVFVPPAKFLGIRRRRPVVRVLSREEAGRFLRTCGSLPDTRITAGRGLVHGTALWLMLLTGLRRGEVLALRNDDVDLVEGVITVQHGKFGKRRFVPLAPDVAEHLRRYHEAIGVHASVRDPSESFFPGPDGVRPCTRTTLYRSFRLVLKMAGIHHGGRGEGPRLHDLRHTFAVLRLLRWYEAGADLQVQLPRLATYLGHVGLSTSQVYIHMTQDLVGEVLRRQQAHCGDIITAAVSS